MADFGGWIPPTIRNSPDSIPPWAIYLQKLLEQRYSHGMRCLPLSGPELPSPIQCTRESQQLEIVTRPGQVSGIDRSQGAECAYHEPWLRYLLLLLKRSETSARRTACFKSIIRYRRKNVRFVDETDRKSGEMTDMLKPKRVLIALITLYTANMT